MFIYKEIEFNQRNTLKKKDKIEKTLTDEELKAWENSRTGKLSYCKQYGT
ncbi:hypothetical protein [Nitrosomonas sp. Nm33]|nr:hypothetical protein [Nitrosomonas sp. Nm33]